MPGSGFLEYERRIEPARQRFAANPTLAELTAADIDPFLLELFLLNFAAMGVQMTEPVEGWIRRAAQRCAELGDPVLAQALQGHAAAEAGHHLMMIHDTHALVARINARHSCRLDAGELLEAPPCPGAAHYIRVHERVIGGPVPFGQVALEYEIEMLPLRYGPTMLSAWVACLGREILECLSFITEHIELDVGHTKFNARQLEQLLERNAAVLPTLVEDGEEVLEAYGIFLTDCLKGAARMRKDLA